MSVYQKVLVGPKTLENTEIVQYTVPSNVQWTVIDKITCTNYSGSPVTVSIWLPLKDVSAGNANLSIKQYSIGASQTYTFPEITGQVLPTGAKIVTLVSATGAINMRISGREVT